MYLDYEVCETCRHATMHSCGRCLAQCAIGHRPDCIIGACAGYDGPDETLLRMREEARERAW